MAKTARTAMNNILTAIEADYEALGSKKSFHTVGLIWHISSGTAWRMIKKGHWPSSKRIRRVLMEKAKERGIEIVRRKRVRVELDPAISKDDLKEIRELTVKDRTEILIKSIQKL